MLKNFRNPLDRSNYTRVTLTPRWIPLTQKQGDAPVSVHQGSPPGGPFAWAERKSVSLLDDLNNPPKRAVTFPEWLLKQEPEIRAALDAAAADRESWSDSALENLLRKHGASCSLESIRAWRDDVAAR